VKKQQSIVCFTVALVAFAFAQLRGADAQCTAATLKGPYSAVSQGIQTGPLTTVPVAITDSCIFDGIGTVSCTSTQSVDGVVQTITSSGNYSLGPTCDGILVLNVTFGGEDEPGETRNYKISAASDGSRATSLRTDFGQNVSAVYNKTAAGICSNATLNGSYQWSSQGMQKVGLGLVTVPQLQAWTINFDGHGGTTGSGTQVQDGVVLTGNYTGTYNVSANCMGTYTATINLSNDTSEIRSFSFIVNPDGSGIIATRKDAGSTRAGVATRR